MVVTTNWATELGEGNASPAERRGTRSVKVVGKWRQTRQTKDGWEGEGRIKGGGKGRRVAGDHLVRQPLGWLAQLVHRRERRGRGNKGRGIRHDNVRGQTETEGGPGMVHRGKPGVLGVPLILLATLNLI